MKIYTKIHNTAKEIQQQFKEALNKSPKNKIHLYKKHIDILEIDNITFEDILSITGINFKEYCSNCGKVVEKSVGIDCGNSRVSLCEECISSSLKDLNKKGN